MDAFLKSPHQTGTGSAVESITQQCVIIRKAARSIEREREKLQGKEKTYLHELRQCATRGDVQGTKQRAMDLTRHRNQIRRMQTFESQLSLLESRVKTMAMTEKISNVIGSVAESLKSINNASNMSNSMKSLASFDRQMQMMDSKMETMDSLLNDISPEEESESDEIVDKVLTEIGLSMQEVLAVAGNSQLPATAAAHANNPVDAQLQKRFQALNTTAGGQK
jgi:charged multivesicular body protein 2A